LPLTSIPPPAPPEQAASDQVSTFEVFTGGVAGAPRTILLACAATIFAVGDNTDILAERIKGAAAWVDT